MKTFSALVLTLLAPALVLALGSAASTPTALNVSAGGHGYDAPASVQAGYVTLTLSNRSRLPVDIGFFRLKPGASEAQFRKLGTKVATQSARDADYRLAAVVDAVGGVGDVQPGKSSAATFQLRPGRYILASLDADDKTKKTAMSQGYYRYLTVTGPALSNAPASADYTINMVDYRFQLPGNVTAGRHTFHITNTGREAHFTLLARLLPGKTMQDVMKAMSSKDQSAPPPVDFAHSSFAQVITSGQAEDVTWNLDAGSYVAVCFVADRRGVPHAQMGMMQELVVR